jgi:Kdo2-lipid IVA lauroyltransferase/acyltransferase
MGRIGALIALGIMWLLHFLPLRSLAKVGEALGWMAYFLARERRRVCLLNLARCFPALSETERRALAKQHFRLFGRFVLEHGLLWWAPAEWFRKNVTIEGEEHLRALRGQPVIILAPHFLGLGMGGTRIAVDGSIATMYQKQKNKVFDERIRQGRLRYGRDFPESRLFSRQDGVLAVARTIKRGVPFYYLPDLDFGPRDTIFVPFFGVPAATITGVARLARLAGAKVIPCVTRMMPGAEGYRVKLYPPWEHFPTNDVLADTRRMNAFIEDRVREMPEQYYWLHKRFKTRPPGEAGFY